MPERAAVVFVMLPLPQADGPVVVAAVVLPSGRLVSHRVLRVADIAEGLELLEVLRRRYAPPPEPEVPDWRPPGRKR